MSLNLLKSSKVKVYFIMIKNFFNNYLSIFPTLIFVIFLRIYYDGEIFKLSNQLIPMIVLLICLPFLNSYVFKLKKELIFFYLLILVSLFSIAILNSKEFQLIGLKRYLIIFLTSFLIIQTYSNHKITTEFYNKMVNIFIIFVFFLCFYALIVFLFDLKYLGIISSETDKTIIPFRHLTHKVTSNFFNFGQIYYTRNDFFLSPDEYGQLQNKMYWFRPSSMVSNSIGFSQLILFSIVILLGRLQIMKSPILYLLLLIFIFSLIWTFSRINIILFLFIPLIILITNKPKLLASLIIFSTTCFLFIFYFKEFHLVTNLYRVEFIGNLFDRFEIYRIALNRIDQFFLTGIGFGLSNESFTLLIKESLTEHNRAENISLPSVPITILLEIGIFGLISYVMLLSHPYLRIKTSLMKINPETKTLILLLTIIFFTQFFDISLFRFHPTTFFFMVILGILINKINIKNERI